MFLPKEDSNSDEDPYSNKPQEQEQEEEKNETDEIDPLGQIQSISLDAEAEKKTKSEKLITNVTSMNAEINSYEERMIGAKNVVFFKV